MKKRIASIMLAASMAVTPVTGMIQAPVLALAAETRVLPFSDVARSSTYYSSILKCYNEGWLRGVNQNEFQPNEKLTRAQFAIVLARYDEADVSGYTSCPLTDVDFRKTYAKSVAWAYEKGITTGSHGLYKPGDPVTRAQFVAFLYKYMKYRDIELLQELDVTFTDEDSISSTYKNAVHTLANAGVISGSQGKFNPNEPCTRAQCAAFLVKFDKAVQKALAVKEEETPETPTQPEKEEVKPLYMTKLDLIEGTTLYTNYYDLFTSTATTRDPATGAQVPVFNGRFSVMEETLLDWLLQNKGTYTLETSASPSDGKALLLFDTENVDKVMQALKQLNFTNRGTNLDKYLHVYTVEYNGKKMVAVKQDHLKTSSVKSGWFTANPDTGEKDLFKKFGKTIAESYYDRWSDDWDYMAVLNSGIHDEFEWQGMYDTNGKQMVMYKNPEVHYEYAWKYDKDDDEAFKFNGTIVSAYYCAIPTVEVSAGVYLDGIQNQIYEQRMQAKLSAESKTVDYKANMTYSTEYQRLYTFSADSGSGIRFADTNYAPSSWLNAYKSNLGNFSYHIGKYKDAIYVTIDSAMATQYYRWLYADPTRKNNNSSLAWQRYNSATAEDIATAFMWHRGLEVMEWMNRSGLKKDGMAIIIAVDPDRGVGTQGIGNNQYVRFTAGPKNTANGTPAEFNENLAGKNWTAITSDAWKAVRTTVCPNIFAIYG